MPKVQNKIDGVFAKSAFSAKSTLRAISAFGSKSTFLIKQEPVFVRGANSWRQFSGTISTKSAVS